MNKLGLLAECAGNIGDVQVRNRGTIGGSLAHSDPAADYPAAVLALEGEVRLESATGARTVKAEDFFIDLMTTAIKPGEIDRGQLRAAAGGRGLRVFQASPARLGFRDCRSRDMPHARQERQVPGRACRDDGSRSQGVSREGGRERAQRQSARRQGCSRTRPRTRPTGSICSPTSMLRPIFEPNWRARTHAARWRARSRAPGIHCDST